MPLDPQISTLLAALEASGASTPMSASTPLQARETFKALTTSRRNPGAGYVPQPVASVNDRTILGDAGPIPIRVYTPPEDRGRVVTYLHGGGFVIGDLDTHDHIARMISVSLGAVVVSVDYRLAPEHPYPAALDDATAATAWTARTFPERLLIVAGDSAGASLAIGAALRARDGEGPTISALLLGYPPADPTLSMPSVEENGEGYFLTAADLTWFFDQYLRDPAQRREPAIDLLHADLTGLPPTMITTAEFDPLRDEGNALAARLAAAGVLVKHHFAAGLIHGYLGFADTVDVAAKATRDVMDTLDALVRGADHTHT